MDYGFFLGNSQETPALLLWPLQELNSLSGERHSQPRALGIRSSFDTLELCLLLE